MIPFLPADVALDPTDSVPRVALIAGVIVAVAAIVALVVWLVVRSRRGRRR